MDDQIAGGNINSLFRNGCGAKHFDEAQVEIIQFGFLGSCVLAALFSTCLAWKIQLFNIKI